MHRLDENTILDDPVSIYALIGLLYYLLQFMHM